MANSVRKNFIYNTVFQAVILLVPIITTPYVARVLGSENVGKYSFATSIVTYFVVFATLGSTVYGQRLVAFNRDDRKELSEAFWEVFLFRLTTGLLFLLLYFLYLLTVGELNLLTAMVSLNILNVIIDITWFFQGVEEFKTTIIRSILVKLISLVCIFMFVKNREDTWIYTLIFCGSMISGNLILWIPLRRYIIMPKKPHPFRHTKGMILIFLPTIASQVYTILDKSMIGWITGSDYANGCYEQSERLARAALTIITAVGAVILPRVANLYKKGETEQARSYVYKSFRIVWAMGLPIALGLVTTASMLIPVYLGKGYDLSILLIQIFSLLVLFVSLAYVTGVSYLTPTNQQNVYTLSVVAAAVVNFIMNCFLIRSIGAVGAAIASVTAEGVGVAIQLGYCIRKKQLATSRIFSSSVKYLIAAGIMSLAVIFVKRYLTVSAFNLIILIMVGGIVYITALYILKDELIFEGFSLIKRKIRR